MNRTVLATGFLACSAIGSNAAQAAGTCPYDPATGIVITPETGAISLTFNLEPYFQAGPGSVARCSLSLPAVAQGPEGAFTVYSADYRGFVSEGDIAQLTVSQDGRPARTVMTTSTPEFILRSYVGTNGGETLDSTIQLQLAQAADASSLTSIDTIDYALAATTTRPELEASLDSLGAQRTATLVHLQTVAGLLTGIDRPFDRPDQFRLIGASGSYLAGAAGRWSLSDTLTLDAGAAAFGLSEDEADARGGMAAATLRYLSPTQAAARPFAEAGIDLAPLEQRFARDYSDGTDDGGSGSGSTRGFAGGLHASTGVLLQPNDANRIALSAAVSQDWLATGAYAEHFGDDNLFAATLSSATTALTTLKLGAAWTATLTPALDVTLNAAAGRAFADGTLHADVSFAGTVEGHAPDDTFVQYGARLGFKPGNSFSADLFAQGISAEESGTHVFWGGSLGRSF